MPEVKTLAEAVKKLYVSRGGDATDIKEGDDVADILAKLYEVMGGEETLPNGSTMATIVDKLSTTQGGGSDLGLKKIKLKINIVNGNEQSRATLNFNSAVLNVAELNVGKLVLYDFEHVSDITMGTLGRPLRYQFTNGQEIELLAPTDGGVACMVDDEDDKIDSTSPTADVDTEKTSIYFTGDGEVLFTPHSVN